MPRKPDPTLKPAIIAKVAEHLHHTKLEDVSVRSLGRVLGTSAYPIVYHFGSRGALIDAVVEHLSSTACDATLDPAADHTALADYFVGVFGGLDDRDRSLAARLTFELGSVESLGRDDDHVRERERMFQRDQVVAIGAWCTAHGYTPPAAERAAREAVLAARGLQWGAVVDRSQDDTDAALRALARSLACGASLSAA